MASSRSTYSLSSILLLVACIGVLLATTRSALFQVHDSDLAIGLTVGCGTFGGIVGIVCGVSSGRYLLGSVAGGCVGAIAGALAGAQLAAPPDPIVAPIGILVLLTAGFVLQRKLDPGPGPEPQARTPTDPDQHGSE